MKKEKSARSFLSVKKHLEQKLLLDVFDVALSAESGTKLHGFENIVGVGIGEKLVGGEYTGERCCTVYVVAKAPKDAVEKAALVPEDIRGIPTDIVATGELHALPHRGRYRPAPGGVSVGHYKITAGTIGCLVRSGNLQFILSNNHVLANSNDAQNGDAVVQPGPADGGAVPRDVIAKLSKFVRIRFGGAINTVDCSIAKPTATSIVSRLSKCFDRIAATPVPPQLNLLVKKCGRTTQFTRGRIVDINATVRVSYGTAGSALFRDQILIVSLTGTPFSAGGDSGSLIVTDVGTRPVGLLFAGSPSHTVGNRIGNVLAALGVNIVS